MHLHLTELLRVMPRLHFIARQNMALLQPLGRLGAEGGAWAGSEVGSNSGGLVLL